MSAEGGIVVSLADAGVVNADNPWPGLLQFREADQAWFQGRRTETMELLRLVMRERLTVLFGLSGLGKSSLLQAGLFPHVRREHILPVYVRLNFLPQGPSLIDQVRQAIAKAAAAAEVEAPAGDDAETLWEYFHRRDRDFWDRRNRPVVPLLVFDQFEEIFTLGRVDAERTEATEAFIDELADLAEGSPPAAVEARIERHPENAERFLFGAHRYKILLVIREDFLPDLESLRRRMSAITLNRLRLRRMNGEAALLAVNQAPHLIDKATAERVVRFVAADESGGPLVDLEVEPALLSVVCSELNIKRRKQGQPRITASLLEGNQEEVISNFYERSVADQGPAVRAFLEEHLLTVSGYRDSVALENALNTPGVSRRAIDLLVERRLIRIEDRGAGQRLELTHDLLAGVVRASRDRRRRIEAEERERAARKAAEDLAHRTLRQLWRSRLIAAVCLVLALLAGVGLVNAYLAQRKAVVAQNEAVLQREGADRSAAQAAEAAKRAEAARAQEEVARIESEKARRQAEADRARAKQSEVEATTAGLAAERERKNALSQADIANQQRARAVEASREAEESAKKAADQAAEAERQRQLAQAAQQNEKAQRDVAEKQSKELAKTLAQSDVRDTARLVDAGQRREAFAYLSRALREDPASVAARSWVFDLMARGSETVPSEPLRLSGRVYPMTHNALRLSERGMFASFSPDGLRVVTASFDNNAQMWNVDSGMPVGPPLLHRGLVNSASFSPDGKRILTASQDGTAQLWDVSTGPPAKLVLRHTLPVNFAAFNADGTRVVTASQDDTARVWDSQSGMQLAEFRHPRPVTSAAFSPDGLHLVTGSWDSNAQIWNVRSGAREGPAMAHRGQVNFVGFSPDGRRVVTASSDGTAQVWEGGRLVGQPMRHAGRVNSAAFSPDGLRVVTASDDNTARVWEADTGTPIGAPLRHLSRVNSAAFSRDGRRVVTASYDRTAQVWEVWYEFDDASLLADLAAEEGGYQIDKLPDLQRSIDPSESLTKLRQKVENAPTGNTTAAFVRWFLSRPR